MSASFRPCVLHRRPRPLPDARRCATSNSSRRSALRRCHRERPPDATVRGYRDVGRVRGDKPRPKLKQALAASCSNLGQWTRRAALARGSRMSLPTSAVSTSKRAAAECQAFLPRGISPLAFQWPLSPLRNSSHEFLTTRALPMVTRGRLGNAAMSESELTSYPLVGCQGDYTLRRPSFRRRRVSLGGLRSSSAK
jgi:hypothetical protein